MRRHSCRVQSHQPQHHRAGLKWPYLDEGTLLKTRRRKVCITCHWFRHHACVGFLSQLSLLEVSAMPHFLGRGVSSGAVS
jgi:hypothetical protein